MYRTIGWLLVAVFGVSVAHATPQTRSDQWPAPLNQQVHETTSRSALVRQSVYSLLEHSLAFRRLSPAKQQNMTKHLMAVSCAYVAEEIQNYPAGFVQSVDFPAFVSGLIEGTFNSMVHASIEQMEAFGELLDEASSSLGSDPCAEPGKIDPWRRRAILTKIRRQLNAGFRESNGT
jgi:hypothetical protein